MNTFRSTALVFGATLLVTMAASAAPEQLPEELPESGQITLTSAKGSSDDVSGMLTTPSGVMSFRTGSSTQGKSTARGAKPDRVKVTLKVNGAVIRHAVDDAEGTVTISTDGRTVTLDNQDVNVLKTFQQEFGREALTEGTFDSMPRATEVLWRLSEMYSEAPVGVTLKRVNVISLKPPTRSRTQTSTA
jgi:hypothetical protein